VGERPILSRYPMRVRVRVRVSDRLRVSFRVRDRVRVELMRVLRANNTNTNICTGALLQQNRDRLQWRSLHHYDPIFRSPPWRPLVSYRRVQTRDGPFFRKARRSLPDADHIWTDALRNRKPCIDIGFFFLDPKPDLPCPNIPSCVFEREDKPTCTIK